MTVPSPAFPSPPPFRRRPARGAIEPPLNLLAKGNRGIFAFFLVASGSLAPLTYLPIKYEWLILASLVLLFFGIVRSGRIKLDRFGQLMLRLILLCSAYQLLKLGLADQPIAVRHVFRGMYGLIAFVFALVTFSSMGRNPHEVMRIANVVVLILAVLVLLSLVAGLKLYATGFDIEESTADIAERITAGNYRVITYFTSFIPFPLFYSLNIYLKNGSYSALINVVVALFLVLATASRSWISPVVFTMFLTLLLRRRFAAALGVLLTICLITVLATLVMPEIVHAFVMRFEVANFVDDWRALEQRLALGAFASHPLLGLPLGIPYTDVMSALAGGGDEGFAGNADYDLHNEYIWHLLYFGVLGSILVAGTIVTMLVRVWKACGSTPQGQALLGYALVNLVTMYYSSSFIRGIGGMWLGIMAGICLGAAPRLIAGKRAGVRSGHARPAGLPAPPL